MITPIHISPPYILKLNYEFDFESLKNKIEENIKFASKYPRHTLESGDSTSTNTHNISGNPHKWEENKDFIKFLFDNMGDILSTFRLMQAPIEIKGSWINHHGKTGQTLEHNHSFMDLVMACYLKCPEGTGNFLARDPLEYHKSHTYLEDVIHSTTKDYWPWVEIPVQTNDILVFPGWLYHKTQENLLDIDRYVMTINWKYITPTFDRNKDAKLRMVN